METREAEEDAPPQLSCPQTEAAAAAATTRKSETDKQLPPQPPRSSATTKSSENTDENNHDNAPVEPPRLEEDDQEEKNDDEQQGDIEVTYSGDSGSERKKGSSDSERKDGSSISKTQSPAKRLAQTVVQSVVPRYEPLPWSTFFVLSSLVAMPSALYIVLFTKMGMGMEWFYYLADEYGDEYGTVVGAATAGWFLVLYLLDADSWTNHVWLQRFCSLIFFLGVTLMVLFMTGDYPYGPICLFAFATPLWLITANKFNCLDRIRTRVYVGWLSGPLFFVSGIIVIIWLIWMFVGDENEYNQVTKAIFAQATGCEPNLEDYPYCSDEYANELLANMTNSTTAYNNASAVDIDIDEDADLINNTTSTAVKNVTRYLHELVAAQVAQSREATSTTTTIDSYADSITPSPTTIHDTDDDDVEEDYNVCFDVIESPPSFSYDPTVCDPSCTTEVYDNCLNAFILWAGPLLVSMVLFFLSFFCTFLKSDSSERDILNFGKLWIFLLFAMWMIASLAGVAAGLSSALIAMTLASFVGSIIFVAVTRSRSESKEQATELWSRINENYGPHLDVARGLFLVTCAPFILLYLVLSVLNQLVRRLGLPCSKELKTQETQQDFVTKRTRTQINSFLSWDRAKVLTYAVYWGIAFMILWVIVAQFTVLFLSWLIEVTSSMNLGAVTAILSGVGMIMFLLPPVPGVPIYLTLGIVILAVGRPLMGIIGSICYASAVSLLLKLVACTVQQKVIGESLARYVAVRKLVQINSTLIKGMRLILAQPGMGIDKVAILVGGPDWPTSVLCGIMGLDLIPVLIGTLPVFLLILPTVLIGSFTYMAGLKTPDGELEFPFAAVLGTVFAAITAVVQFGAMVLAAYYLERTTSQRSEEVEAIEIDKEVAELEASEAHLNNCYSKVTQWEVLPRLAKLVLYLAFVFMVASCYMVMLFANACFAQYELTYTIEEHLGGNWLNIVLPVGWYAILLFVISCVLLFGFTTWASRRAAKEAGASVPSGEHAAGIAEQAQPVTPTETEKD